MSDQQPLTSTSAPEAFHHRDNVTSPPVPPLSTALAPDTTIHFGTFLGPAEVGTSSAANDQEPTTAIEINTTNFKGSTSTHLSFTGDSLRLFNANVPAGPYIFVGATRYDLSNMNLRSALQTRTFILTGTRLVTCQNSTMNTPTLYSSAYEWPFRQVRQAISWLRS